MKKILLVDDEQEILNSLKRIFLRSKYETYYAHSCSEALAIMKEKKIDLIITDIRMSQISGYDLLKQVKKLYPKVIRVALSGYADKKDIYRALETNLIKIYIFKPWNNKEIKEMIEKLLNLKDIISNKKLLNLFNNLDNLPTTSNLYNELTNLIEKESDISIITSKISKDQSICAKILRVANSAFYQNKINSLEQAIMFMGLGNIRNIILANSIFNSLNININVVNYLWEHSEITNKMTNLIYEQLLDKKIPKLNSIAGILHDIGKIILLEHYKNDYKQVYSLLKKNKDMSIIEAEKKVLGITHAELGGLLLNWWDLSLPLVEGALYHHNPLDKGILNKELVSVIHIANYYSHQIIKCELETIKLEPKVFDYLNIDPISCEKLKDKLCMNIY